MIELLVLLLTVGGAATASQARESSTAGMWFKCGYGQDESDSVAHAEADFDHSFEKNLKHVVRKSGYDPIREVWWTRTDKLEVGGL